MERKQPDLVLIVARSFATKLATPTLADSRGNLVFFNDAASEVLGRSYLDVWKLPASRWQELFEPRTFDEQPHDPMRSDRALEELYDGVAEVLRDDQEPSLIAREGLEIELGAAP